MKRSIITLFVTSCLVSEAMCTEQKNEHAHDRNTITIEFGETCYQLSKKNLAQSGILSNIPDDTQSNKLDISDLCQRASLSQETFADVIIPALQKGENYTLSQHYPIKKLIEITRAANYLDMPHLLNLVIKRNAEYIINNIDTFGEKNSSLCKFGTELPQEILEQIKEPLTPFFAPALCATISNCTTLSGHTGGVGEVVFSPDGKTIASSSNDGGIKLWSGESKTLLATLSGSRDGSPISVVFSPDSKTLASYSRDDTIKLWDVESKKLLATLSGHTDWVLSVVFSPDGKTLVSCSADNTIKLWGVESRELLTTLSGHTNLILSVVFSPDGKLIAFGGYNGTIYLLDVKSKTIRHTLLRHHDDVVSVVFSPDGKTLASRSVNFLANCSDLKNIKLWDVESGALLATLSGHKEVVTSVAFSPNGEILASCSNDNTVKLWDVKYQILLATLSGHTSFVWSVAFSPDGKTLASCSSDTTIKLWRIPDVSFEQALLVLYIKKARQPLNPDDLKDHLKKIYETFDDTQKQHLTPAIKRQNLENQSSFMEQKRERVNDINPCDRADSLSKEAFKKSINLNQMHPDYMNKNNFNFSTPFSQKPSQKTFADGIMSARQKGNDYRLIQNHYVEKLVEITRAAIYLNKPDLLKAVIKNNAEYIIKNIDTFGEKNSSLCKFGTELPQDILEQITEQITPFFVPTLWETVSHCTTLSGQWRIPDFSFDQALLVLYVLQKARRPLNLHALKDHLKEIYETFDDTQKKYLNHAVKRKKPKNQSFFYGNYWRLLTYGAIGTTMVLAYLFFKTKK